MDTVNTAVEGFFTDIQSLLQVIAPIFAFLAVVGIGMMYMGSSMPILSDWKRNNPQAASSVVMGLIFVLLASSVAGLISFT